MFKSYFHYVWVKVVKKVPHTGLNTFNHFAGHSQGCVWPRHKENNKTWMSSLKDPKKTILSSLQLNMLKWLPTQVHYIYIYIYIWINEIFGECYCTHVYIKINHVKLLCLISEECVLYVHTNSNHNSNGLSN